MKRHLRIVAIVASFALAAASGPALAARHPVPHGGGGGGAAHYGGSGRGTVPSRGTAHGSAHYGYYGSYGYHGYPGGGWWGYPYYGYPYAGWWGPGWSIGFSYGWGWPYGYGYGYGYPYGAWYGPTYVVHGSPTTPAVIETAVTPKNAEVVLDGTSVGYAKDYNGRWDELRVSPGHHTLEIRDSGRQSLVIDLYAAPGATYRIDRELAAGTGEDRLTVGSPKAAARAAPAESASAAPAPSSGVVRGLLRVHAEPQDASVYLDGEFLGLAGELDRLHGAIPVATGTHRIEVVRPGYAGQTKSVDVGAEGTSSIEIALGKN